MGRLNQHIDTLQLLTCGLLAALFPSCFLDRHCFQEVHLKNFEEIVKSYPCKINLSEDDVVIETRMRLVLIDFLRGLVEVDPAKRWSPFQAAKHPFITGEPFTCPYNPLRETPHVVSQIESLPRS